MGLVEISVRAVLGLLGLLTWVAAAQAVEPAWIGGLAPDRRPEAAPRITQFALSEREHQLALKGVVPPAVGLGFLADQGPWYTPFNRPNMPGRYDLRGLHAPERGRR